MGHRLCPPGALPCALPCPLAGPPGLPLQSASLCSRSGLLETCPRPRGYPLIPETVCTGAVAVSLRHQPREEERATLLRENTSSPTAPGGHLATPSLNGGIFKGISPFCYQQSLVMVCVLQGREGDSGVNVPWLLAGLCGGASSFEVSPGVFQRPDPQLLLNGHG